MPKIILTVNEAILTVLPLTKERTTIGRRPNNDMVVDHVAISSEHAAIIASNNTFILEDLNSTNGTEVNGHSIKRYHLQNNDVIGLAPYLIRFVIEDALEELAQDGPTTIVNQQVEEALAPTEDKNDNISLGKAAMIRVLNGPSTGKEMTLSTALTTIGRPGVQVAAITHRRQGYFIAHVEGKLFPLVNGVSIESNA
ncbi:MAG TPA: FHA domain-containing protein, partial [Burkholderiaceae bacterium]|nr:FHA domain-containing protein [Burkholderiaceae bacterium]